ncbi:MAG: GDP-mannose 4,6-dehydratase [Candidatus Omnitrophica bacterium]|nr:GDP-mannose 4,6-dehydratase [Candidatus Omnitrophota bacterium]MCM8788199.1 GDP-mannose 4,6-dehydratase [Candidatus Omnitrophota bacterium]
MDTEFWKEKKVLITGYEGFVGSWLCSFLLKAGAEIFGLDIKTHRRQTILSQDELTKIKITKGSVENFNIVYDLIRNNRIEIVFHLAAKSIVGDCFKNPLRALKTNVSGTVNILESCRRADWVKTVVIASSDKAYGEHKRLPYKENTPLQGSYPYDVSKSCSDLIAQMYHHTYDVPVVITRCGNIYGPGDFNFSRIVPDATRCAISGRTFLIRSDGKFTRDYIYVEDIIKGYIMLAQKAEKLNLFGQAFNFSNEQPVSVVSLVKKIYKVAKRKPTYSILNQTKCEIKHQYLSSDRAKKILKWKPDYSLGRGLKKTCQWYSENFRGGKK